MSHEEIDRIARMVTNWHRWGEDDQLGTLNNITPDVVKGAAGLVRDGQVVSLAVPFDSNGPQVGGHRHNPIHLMLVTGTDYLATSDDKAAFYADDTIILPLQCSTQWDSLAHIFYSGKMYNDRSPALVDSRGARSNGIENAAAKIVTRGVLLDVARHLGVEALGAGYAITADDLMATAKAENVQIQAGDALLVRTGHINKFRARPNWQGFITENCPGLSLYSAEWLRSSDVAIVATDTHIVEVKPHEIEYTSPFHRVAVVYMGLLLGEIFDLDKLADACRRENRYEFLFVGAPLPITGAVGSPVNPYAVL